MIDNKQTEPYTLSQLQMYDECAQKYKLCYVDKLPTVERLNSSASSRTGNNLHNIINYYLKGQDVSKLVQALTPVESELWQNFKKSHAFDYKFLKSEYAFNVKISNYWFTGRIDALFKDTQKGEYIIFDWKTGENFNGDNVSFQTAFYLLCLYEILTSVGYIDTPSQLSLHYINLATNNIIKIKLVPALLQQYKDKILGTVEKINNDKTFFCNKTAGCKICKYSSSCAYY